MPTYNVTMQGSFKTEDQDAGTLVSEIIKSVGTIKGVRIDSMTVQRMYSPQEQQAQMNGYDPDEVSPEVAKLRREVEQLQARLELREVPSSKKRVIEVNDDLDIEPDVLAETRKFIDPFEPPAPGMERVD